MKNPSSDYIKLRHTAGKSCHWENSRKIRPGGALANDSKLPFFRQQSVRYWGNYSRLLLSRKLYTYPKINLLVFLKAA